MAALRLQHDRSAALGVPAHVTILYPFLDPVAIDERALEELIAGHEAFDFELVSVETFDDGHVYLVPTRPERFVALIDAVWRRWPDHPPYEWAFETVVPHLTISERPLECAIELPIAARADTVTLIEEQADGRWLSRRRFALG